MKHLLFVLVILILFHEMAYSQERKYQFIPTVAVGVGVTKFLGDISDKGKTNVHFFGNRFAYDGTFGVNLSNSFDLNLNVNMGKISGNENLYPTHRNFEASFLNMGTNLEYNFGGLFKRRPVLSPFFSVGFYYGRYTVSNDLYDRNGKLYYYWTDGKIRDVAEGSPEADNAKLLSRDFTYETKAGDNPVSSFMLPVGGGLDFHLGKRFVFRLNSKYFFAFSDKLDGFVTQPSSKFNDGFFYNSVSVFFNLVPDKSNYLTKEELKELDAEDYDNDGVPDILDECGETPAGVPVNEKGCPIDTDGDGIPDYLDAEPNSPSSDVGTDGVLLDYLSIAKNASDSISLLHTLLQKYPNMILKSSNQNFTIHVGTFKKSNSAQQQFLKSIQGIKETKVNDSLYIYSVGNYDKFDNAEKERQELQKKGFEHTFEVPEKELTEVSFGLNKVMKDTLETPEEKKLRQQKELQAMIAPPSKNEGKYVEVAVVPSDEKKSFDADKKLIKENNERLLALEKEAKKQELAAAKKEVVEEKAAIAVVEKRTEPEIENKDLADKKPVEAVADLSEEKRQETIVTSEKKDVQEKTLDIVSAAEIKKEEPVKEEKSNDVVRFCVDVVEHAENSLSLSVLLVMQREGLSTQVVRKMGAKIYTVGNYKSLKDAQNLKAEINGLGVGDVTIIGAINNIKVTQLEAEAMLKKIGE